MTDNSNKLLEALSQFQADNITAKKNAKNPFFKSDYANLDEVIHSLENIILPLYSLILLFKLLIISFLIDKLPLTKSNIFLYKIISLFKIARVLTII